VIGRLGLSAPGTAIDNSPSTIGKPPTLLVRIAYGSVEIIVALNLFIWIVGFFAPTFRLDAEKIVSYLLLVSTCALLFFMGFLPSARRHEILSRRRYVIDCFAAAIWIVIYLFSFAEAFVAVACI
jgi:hypothetical protein